MYVPTANAINTFPVPVSTIVLDHLVPRTFSAVFTREKPGNDVGYSTNCGRYIRQFGFYENVLFEQS